MAPSRPNIGIDNAATQLHNNLHPAYRRFSKQQTGANALEVAQAAWAMVERRWHDLGRAPSLENLRTDLISRCPELKLMRDYVETAKHVELDRSNVDLVRITGAENPGGVLEVSAGPVGDAGPFRGMVTRTPECTLTFECKDGSTYSVPDVLRRVVEFWSNELR